MAIHIIPQEGPNPSEQGQGAVEAILTLPVFLILITVLFQSALLCMAQVTVQYAAFSAARTGAVWNGDMDQMTAAAGRVLLPVTGRVFTGKHPFKVEIISSEAAGDQSRKSDADTQDTDRLLRVRVTWNYPLMVPLAGRLLNQGALTSAMTRPSLPLTATWSLPMEPVRMPRDARGNGHAHS
ncbi:MAG: pilus assembly protein [Deltaproteobacteria bacterium]|nr:pilus assembly protein [Deltaproteobacteria bacterium]